MNMVALVDNQPRVLNLKDLLRAFISPRREVVTRRTVYELKRRAERGHILKASRWRSQRGRGHRAHQEAPSPADAKPDCWSAPGIRTS